MPFLPFGEVRRGFFFIFFIAVFVSCKKEKPLSTPGAIAGPKNLCPGDSGITYSINPIEGSTFYLWTVPDGSRIVLGQGTTSIVMCFGNKSGLICVRSNNDKEFSDASCLELTQGGASNTWCREMNFKGGARTEAVGFSIGNKGYIGTGFDNLGAQYNDFWEFDPALNSWTQKANFGGLARFDAVGFSIGTKGYIGTGWNGTTHFKDFWEYNSLLNEWMQKADCGDTARSSAFGFSIGNKGYIGSGSNVAFYARTDFYEYDPAIDQWTRKADVIPRSGGSGFSIGNKGYFGMGTINGSSYYNDFWEFDPLDSSNGFDVNNNPIGKWTQKETFPNASRYAAIGFSIGNKGYIGLGRDGGIYYNDFFEYDPNSDTWLQKANFVGGVREFAVGFAIGKNGYVGTGFGWDDFWVYGQ